MSKFTLSSEQQDYIIFIGLIAACMFAVVVKPGLPVKVETMTHQYYDIVENIPEGSTILFAHDNTISSLFGTIPTDVAVYNHLAEMIREKGIKLVMVNIWVDATGIPAQEYYLENVDWSGLEYGVDYVSLGWVPSMESALAGLYEDIWKTAPKDLFGTDLADIPIMQYFRNGDDVDIFIFTTGTSLDPYMRQWGQHKETVLCNTGLATITMSMQYVERGLIDAYLLSLVPTAGYEMLIDKKGLGTAFVDGNSLSVLYSIALMVVSNIIFWFKGGND
jgi:hypothetical protein